MKVRNLCAGVAVAGLLVGSSVLIGHAAEVSVPQGVQATLAVRTLEYDRALRHWAGGQLVVGVVSRRPSGAGELVQVLGGRDVQGVPVRVAEHAWKDAEGLRAWIDKSGVRLLYLAEDLGGDTAAALSAATGRKLPSVVASRRQFEAGATVGLVVREGRPHILVNLPLSRSAGMDLDPKLLQLAEVVR